MSGGARANSIHLSVVFAILFAFLASGQSQARVFELLQRGVALLEQGRYNDAVNLLEEAWEADQSVASVAEHLAMAYLYADKETSKAGPLAEKAIALGGRASFLMDHPHEKLKILNGDTAAYCRGRLVIVSARITFIADVPGHSFQVESSNLKDLKENRIFGVERGMYHIRTRDKRQFELRPRSGTSAERELIMSLINAYVTH
jgi:hypothetical protein